MTIEEYCLTKPYYIKDTPLTEEDLDKVINYYNKLILAYSNISSNNI